jgi:hypothetical protein
MKNIKREIKTITLSSKLNRLELLIIIHNHLVNNGNGKTKIFFDFCQCFKIYEDISKEDMIECFKSLFTSDGNGQYIIDREVTAEEIDACAKNFKIKSIQARAKKEIAEVNK